MPGKKRAKETRYFFNNAPVLARLANEKATELNDDIVAVLFRDADGKASSNRGEWESKFQSMLDGFAEEKHHRGVPMVAKPKSEAWILCALKSKYQNCEGLEDRSGNDNSPNSLKSELREHLKEDVTRELLCSLVESNAIDPLALQMPSFVKFRDRFRQVIAS